MFQTCEKIWKGKEEKANSVVGWTTSRDNKIKLDQCDKKTSLVILNQHFY